MNSKVRSFYLSDDIIKKINQIAKKLGVSRSKAVEIALRIEIPKLRARKASGV